MLLTNVKHFFQTDPVYFELLHFIPTTSEIINFLWKQEADYKYWNCSSL